MKEENQNKHRGTNIARILTSAFDLFLIIFMEVNQVVLLNVGIIHLIFASLWMISIELKFFNEEKFTYSGFIPACMDITSTTIIIILTGNIHSYLTVGYFIITGVTSVQIKNNFGKQISILCFIQFTLSGVLVKFKILPNLNIFSNSTIDITYSSLAIACFWMAIGLFVINNIIFTTITRNFELTKKAEFETEKSNSLLLDIHRDLSFAKKIQNKLLPEIETYKKEFNLDISIIYEPLIEVGGDLFDFIKLQFDGKLRILLADATGHGVQAALFTMLMKSELSVLTQKEINPAKVLSKLNQIFFEKYQSLNMFCSVFLIDLDLKNRTACYSSAGHPAMYYKDDKEIIPLEKTGKLIGILGNQIYKEKLIHLNKNFQLVLFTDGIYEEFNESKEEFGEERLFEILKDSTNYKGDELQKKIKEEINSWITNSNLQDDITLIIIDEK